MRKLLARSAALVSILATLVVIGQPTPTVQAIDLDSRPNVVLILVDDMAKTDLAYMPEVKRLLSDRGVTFKNGISPNPVCCPARASLITGQYTHNNGVFANKGHYGALKTLRDPNNTLPLWLQEEGYATAFFGKYLNGYGEVAHLAPPAGWDFWDATSRFVYGYTHFEVSNNGDPIYFKDDYITTRQRERSDAVIRDFAAQGKPFFIFDSYVAPHGAGQADPKVVREVGPGAIPEEKYRNLYSDVTSDAALKPSFNVAIKDYPVLGRMRGTHPRDRDDFQKKFLNRIRSLKSVDDAVAQTVETLKSVGEYEDTLFIFASDNGFMLGEHQKFGKEVILQEVVNVPIIVAGPGMPEGERSKRWATLMDVTATILEATGAEPGRKQDGRSLLGAGSHDPSPSTALLIENGNNYAKSDSDPRWYYQGVLMGSRYTYAKWSNMGGAEELYDNKRDPYQMRNVAGEAKYGEVLREARKATRRLKTCEGVKACSDLPAFLGRPRA